MLTLAEQGFVDQICSFRQAVGRPYACRGTKKLHVHNRFWAQLSSHGFSILEFEDHYSVLMVVLALDDDWGPPHDGWIQLEPRRLQLHRELIVKTTPPQTSEAKRLNALHELLLSVLKFMQVLVFGPRDRPRMFRGDSYYAQPALLRVHASGKRRRK